MSKIEYDKDILEKAIKESCSYRQLSKNLGRNNQTKAFRKYIQNCGIDISHFTKRYPGNSNYLNSSGRTYGYLLIDEVYSKKSPLRSNYYAKCTCKCGNKIDVIMTSLTKGMTRSCGCLRKEVKKGKDNASYRGVGDITSTIFKSIKRSAIKRNLEFDITKQYLWDLFLKQDRKCAISGVELSFGSVGVRFTRNTSLDRVDNDKGYTEDNVQWVHKDVNMMKRAHNLSDFIEICKIITENQFKVKIEEGRCELCEESWDSSSALQF